MSGLFSTFNIAKRGMTVQQKSIDVTSHNIANSNTVGYSRQVARIETSRPYGGVTMGASTQPGQLGTGSQIRAIERVRDTFLDYQVRNESSVLGKYGTRDNFLYEVESIFNEPSDTGISNLMGKFFDSFQELSKQPNSSNSRTVAAQQTLALTDALNTTYTQLEKLKVNSKDMLKNTVTEVNSLINQIDRVNQEIISVTVSNNTPNDLMDRRDLLLDELSTKFGIVVEKDVFNGINVKPAESGSVKANQLINSSPNGDVARFSYVTNVEKDKNDLSGSTYIVTYYKNGDMTSEDNKQTMKVSGIDEEKAAKILSNGILWADRTGQASRGDGYPIRDGEVIAYEQLMMFTPTSGTVNGLVSVQKDIQSYMNQLDKLAKSIAFTVNAVHSSEIDAGKDSLPFFVNKDTVKYNPSGTGATTDGEDKISAKNITVNKEILDDVMKINAGKDKESGEGDGQRALAIAQLRNSLVRIQDINETVITREDLFTKGGSALAADGLGVVNSKSGMSLSSYFKDTIDRLGVQAQEAGRMVKNQGDLLYSIEESRASVSGVSLDEEMANLIQFQHAYNANAKIVSTVDELLEVIINGLKR
ncbi:flagellar hook-associated protein FlgK [Clostridium sp.]|uniref:flagellar hook-associated protein FlgK n=1 Tax=Clostridium sp. TaxID=1506 RepID=UPI002637EED5|nr:flagellar hook-associated protein FlgK [Clostridium sp.]